MRQHRKRLKNFLNNNTVVQEQFRIFHILFQVNYRGEGGHHTGLISQVHRQFESVPRIQSAPIVKWQNIGFVIRGREFDSL